MSDSTVTSALDFYAAIGAALFPIQAGRKEPFGIVKSFATDWSRDPEQWKRWHHEHNCNFGIVAGPSLLIIADVDISEVGRDRAWAIWCEWWQSQGLAVPSPYCQSARGGWHFAFALPEGFDVSTLRQVALIGPRDGSKKAIVDLRVNNGFTVAAGSYYDGTAKGEASGSYILLSDAPPHLAPDALIQHCTRAPRNASARVIGSYDINDVAGLIAWLHERNQFDDYDSWYQLGAALRIEHGDAGLELWRIATWDAVDDATLSAKWESFATEPDANSITLSSFLKRASSLGWRGQVRKATAAMFDGVAQIAAAAGASLSGPFAAGSAAAAQGMPMLEGQRVLAELGEPIIKDFLNSTGDAPIHPATNDYPTLPEVSNGHGLYHPLCRAISRMIAMAETPKSWKAARVVGSLAVLSLMHPDVFGAVVRRLQHMGVPVPLAKIKQTAIGIESDVQRACTVTHENWQCDIKGAIEADNPDNVTVFLGSINLDLRWNSWLKRMEVQGGSDPELQWKDWTHIDDTIIAKLRMRAFRTKTRFKPAKDFFTEALKANAHRNLFDPLVERLKAIEATWDGRPRLAIWMTAACGVECNPYHQIVGKNIIGGMVRRARNPGCKHDEVAILIGRQGTGKSTVCRILALDDSWFTDSVSFDGSPQNVIPQLFGKWVVELAELDGMARKEVQHVKRFLSAQSDNFTAKYEAFASDHARRCIFIGTSNEDTPLVDMTGNRRYLPVRVEKQCDLPWLRANIEQLIAEACVLESQGQKFGIPESMYATTYEHQEAARSESDVETMLYEWLGSPPIGSPWSFITSFDLVNLGNMAGWKVTSGALRNTVLKRLGFRKSSAYINGRKTPMWVRGPEALPSEYAAGVRYMVSTGSEGPRVTQRGGGK